MSVAEHAMEGMEWMVDGGYGDVYGDMKGDEKWVSGEVIDM